VFQDGVYTNISTTTRRLASIQTKTRQAGNPRKDVCLPAILMLRSKPLLTNSTPQRFNSKLMKKDGAVKHCLRTLPFQRFRVLFNSLFKVLCNFHSHYLFAIGFPPIFSFITNLRDTLICNPKQIDSSKVYAMDKNFKHERWSQPLRLYVPV
jgi:hypothetical protein